MIIPSTPMKRVSRPTRIALSAISTSANASPSAPGSPSSEANTVRPLVATSVASSTVRLPSRKSLIALLVPYADSTVASAWSTPAISGR